MKRGFSHIRDAHRRKYLKLAFREVRSAFGGSLISFVVFGSVARGDDEKSSDTDVLLILDTDMSYGDRCLELGKVISRLYRSRLARELLDLGYNIFTEFYPLNRSEAEAFRPIYLDIVHDAVIIYDKGDFFKKVLNRVLDLLDRLDARRVWLDRGGWFWILKPDIRFGEEVRYELE